MNLKLLALSLITSLSCAAQTATLEGVKVVAPTESTPFVTEVGREPAPLGLQGRNIALWQSHGWYFEPKANRWEWQRARLNQTVEDLYTQSYVMPFLMPMLENAGAYVMSPRERDINTTEIIVDNDGGLASGHYREHNGHYHWADAKGKGFAHTQRMITDGVNPFANGTARQAATVADEAKASRASWSADIPADGTYAVYVSYKSLPNSAPDATYTIHTAAGQRQFKVDQRKGSGTWIYLGHFPLDKGEREIVTLTNLSSTPESAVTADAVKIGGGMGNVGRKANPSPDGVDYPYITSGYPRFTEGARYWLQWAGAPESVYTPSERINDYTDDYRCRGEWVNWLAGGSSVLPGNNGLAIPIDLSFAFHTDAGNTTDHSVVGTLGIYFTNNNGRYANGTERKASGVLTDMIMTSIVDDIRARYNPDWTRRDMWDKSYYEARVPEVPAMLLELLSHQNYEDMIYGLDPTFRFTVSRAIYKGMLKFIAARDHRPYIVQPLPVNSMAITAKGNGKFQLSWKPTVDSLEATALPTYYIIEERIEGKHAFTTVAKAGTTSWDFSITDQRIHSFRVIAANEGGRSFPSETLAACHIKGDNQPVLIVNGFTRISGPDIIEGGDLAGFDNRADSGVPYINDISFIGEQYEFRRSIPWVDDDNPGHGASRANYEDKVIAGNTFDYPYIHGLAIKAAGRSFVSVGLQAYIDSPAKAQVIDLILGKQKETAIGRGAYGTRYKALPAALQQRLADHCRGGGRVLITGSYIASDLWDNQYSSPEVKQADQKFASTILGYTWRTGRAATTGEAYQVPCRFKQLTTGSYEFINQPSADGYAVESPDSFYPTAPADAAVFMRYSENGLNAATALDNGKWKTVAIGFPFESITDSSSRNSLMQQVLNFFSAPCTGPATLSQPAAKPAGNDKKAPKHNKKKKKSKK